MKKVSLLFNAILLVAIFLTSCKGDGEAKPTLNEIIIGNQVWMDANLNVDKFQNGDPIPHLISDELWERAGLDGTPAWSYYNNDSANYAKYGKLYNLYAVIDPRGLAPDGWKIASDADWTILTDFLGGDTVAGGKMKSISGWENNGNGTNESGFTGLPGGLRKDGEGFHGIGAHGFWWSPPDYHRYCRILSYGGNGIGGHDYHPGVGMSVRCIKD